ncbi:low temperature requirement protein A [Verrucosispora sp. ts21]|uniref:low temperature requirement protein A n=1 Tax=Verrucosispora sp. ts21 TaxID=2069341 RepID=UPI000C88528A|nr:low temperature requirement protein A [Verrucosispora sp. ts21]PMR62489.1 low temperature requirement protein A [Verrucosispora sp. ts21]
MPLPQDPARSARVLRSARTPTRTTLLELFFDLVYVVALALISHDLAKDLTWTQGARTTVLLAAVWWTWVLTTFLTELYDPGHPEIKALVVTVMFGVLLMTTAIPQAFDDRGLIFAIAYVAIHLGRAPFVIPALRHQQQLRQRPIRTTVWFSVSAVPWIVGATVDGDARLALWSLALAIDFLGLWLAYPVPGMGVIPPAHRNATAEHLAERFQQFVMISLGDAILVIGMAYSVHHAELEMAASLVIAFITTLLLWQIYVYKAGELLPGFIKAARFPGRFLKSAPFTHLLMVAGVVVTAAGFNLVTHTLPPRTPPSWAVVILGGPALFLLGRACFEWEVFNRVSPSRPGGILALLTAAPAVLFLPPLAAALAAALVLAGVALADVRRSRGRPPEMPKPSW